MSLTVATMPIGNALKVAVSPPESAVLWRVLRKSANTFTGFDDAGATKLSESDDRFVIDAGADLVNGTPYFYTAYYWDGAAWTRDASVIQATPAAAYQDISVDAMSIVRDRLAVGLKVEVDANVLDNEQGEIKVLTAPPIFEDTKWPVVTVHLQNESPSERGLGEHIHASEIGPDGKFLDGDGWLARTQILVMGWAINPDVRIALRKALRRLIVGNLPVFDAMGMLEVEFTQQDMEDFTTYGAPVYQTIGTLSCLVPIGVDSKTDVIVGVDVSMSDYQHTLTGIAA